MRRDWVVWLICFLLFGSGVVWAQIPIPSNFFIINDVHDLFEIIGALATIVAVCVAAAGINAWRWQLRATSDHDLARKLLISIYKYREVIKRIRHPMIMIFETSADDNEKRSEKPDVERFQGLCKAYSRRFKAAEEIRVLLLSELLEADVVWGERLRTIVSHLIKLELELGEYLRSHLMVINPSEADDMREAHVELQKKRRDILYDDLSVDGDEFTQDFNRHLALSERYLKDKFIR
ncbi:hypothetical protein KW834_03165 [Pseudomonas sp. PDM29]|uniref:hypothetical protein n=1 Tax=Pseudomonas sp. PDM29 TaxID=2854771 RepID=UPI001C45F091|nr:hypothetical protein [Pseudomonas sp. PDM29]MBV7523406.1 hypothetical protein [Pseudomonas sp. PDM29]